MVAGFERARVNRFLAADALLALYGVDDPTPQQRIGALIEAEYKLRMIHRKGW